MANDRDVDIQITANSRSVLLKQRLTASERKWRVRLCGRLQENYCVSANVQPGTYGSFLIKTESSEKHELHKENLNKGFSSAKSKNGFRTIFLQFRKAVAVKSTAKLGFLMRQWQENYSYCMGNQVFNCLCWITQRNLPDPCRPSFFLVKGKMGPNLTHNKLYLLDHDELLNPVKTIKSYRKFLICWRFN